jgi:hypothetical protein
MAQKSWHSAGPMLQIRIWDVPNHDLGAAVGNLGKQVVFEK